MKTISRFAAAFLFLGFSASAFAVQVNGFFQANIGNNWYDTGPNPLFGSDGIGDPVVYGEFSYDAELTPDCVDGDHYCSSSAYWMTLSYVIDGMKFRTSDFAEDATYIESRVSANQSSTADRYVVRQGFRWSTETSYRSIGLFISGLNLFSSGREPFLSSANLVQDFLWESGTGTLSFIYSDESDVDGVRTYTEIFSNVDYIRVASVPEPGTLGLLGVGLAGMVLARRRAKA